MSNNDMIVEQHNHNMADNDMVIDQNNRTMFDNHMVVDAFGNVSKIPHV
jgi:hypothetical protein